MEAALLGQCGNGKGRIVMIIGPMFAGKTKAMMGYVERATLARQNALIIKYAEDIRYEKGPIIRTHSGECHGDSDRLRVVVVSRLADVVISPSEKVIGVDEGQFYPDLVEMCDKWANEGKHVIVAALDGDSSRCEFGTTLQLIPKSEQVIKLNAVCHVCGSQAASFSQMYDKPMVHIVDSTGIEKNIGGSDTYRAVCRTCYHAS